MRTLWTRWRLLDQHRRRRLRSVISADAFQRDCSDVGAPVSRLHIPQFGERGGPAEPVTHIAV